MNFLSHFHLHKNLDDNYYTVGLTLPDLLQFQSRKIRLTTKTLSLLGKKNNNDKKITSLINGMMMHIYVDNWFHSNEFFRANVLFLEETYKVYNEEGLKMPHFFAHILLEIFIDRYILSKNPTIADEFYSSYKKFNFYEATKLFNDYKDFNKENFVQFAISVANSSFLKEYGVDQNILHSLKRVCARIDIPFNLFTQDENIIQFIRESYDKLERKISIFLTSAIDQLTSHSL